MSTPSALNYIGSAPAGSELVQPVGYSYVAQILTAKALANVVVSNSYFYQVRYYQTNQVGSKDGSGLYQIISGQPYVTWTIQNPEPATTNKLQITETRDGASRSWLYEYSASTKTWLLSYLEGDGTGIRQDEFKTEYTTSGGVTNKVETSIIRKPGGADVYKKVSTYRNYQWGTALIEERVGPDASPEITTYHYYTNGAANSSLATLQQVVHPSGYWERYKYDQYGRLTNKVAQFGNTATNAAENVSRVTSYSFTPVGFPDEALQETNVARVIIERLNGQEIGRRYKVYNDDDFSGQEFEVICPTPGAAWNDAGNLTTTIQHSGRGGPLASITAPDGTVTSYSSGFTSAEWTNIVTTPLTRTVTVTSRTNRFTLSRTVYDYSSGSLGVVLQKETYSHPDEFGRPQRVTHLDGTYDETAYACCGVDTFTDRSGIVTQYHYDGVKRLVATTRLGITTSNILDAVGRVVATVRKGSDGSLVTLSQTLYNTAGHMLKATNALGGVTVHADFLDGSGQTIHTNTYPDGGTRIETHFKDGSLASMTGTAAFPVRYEYGVESEGGVQRQYTKEIKLDAAGSDTIEWTKTYSDGAGRTYKTVYSGSGSPYQQTYYNNQGQMWKQRDPDGVITLYSYNAKGDIAYTAIDSNRNDTIDFNGLDRITQTTNDVISGAHSTNVLRTRTYAWLTDGSTTPTLLSTSERSVEGFMTWQTNAGAVSSSVKTLPSAGSYTITQTAPDSSYSVTLYQSGRVASVTRYDSGGSQLGKTTYGYDAHGRQNSVTDARTGTTTFTFNNADQIVSVTTPPPGTGGSAQTTTTYFDTMGRATSVVQPDGTSINNVFSKRGELLLTSGSRNYPVGYSYDAQGRMTTMTNWSTFSSGAGAGVTSWYYHPERGWLTNKLYADAKGTKYSYTAAGRLSTRLWARGTNTTYAYNNFGDLSSVTYNDGGTPTVSYTYTRRGQQDKITRGSDSYRLFYNTAGQLIGEGGTAGTLNGLRVTNAFDQFLRRTNVSSANGATILTTNGYTFDTAGRLSTARDGKFVASYSYIANSPLVSQITHSSNGTMRLTTTKTYDNLNRLQSITSTTNGTSIAVAGYTYSYNDANQRTRVNLADGSFWVYDYDSLGQVKSGKRYWSDWTPVAGQQFEYGFDDIGNRNSTKTGGDSAGANLRSASYTNNTLNQITGRDVPSYLNVIGAASATATNVNVNNTMAYRRGEFYRVELNPNNTNAAVWQSVTNRVVQNGTTNSATGNLFLPKQAEAFSYDADGNLTNDGRWSYVWDGENRLLSMTSRPFSPAGSSNALHFKYDAQGRRISKTVSNYSGSSWSKVIDEKYLYDGWNQLTSLNASNSAVVRAFLWGSDLSGSMQGAGGVGGLLAVNAKGSGVAFVAYDGNGNVAALFDAAIGNTVANYDYGPFGEVIRANGTLSKLNPFRFSTKFQDDETELLYYGYRYYSQSLGRWPSRDPLAERGGRNLYAFCDNKQPNAYDRNGLDQVGSVVTITPKPLPNEDENKHQEGQRIEPAENWQKRDPNRILFIVTSIAEANDKLRSCSKCIKTLNIQGHGAPGYQSVAAEDDIYQDFPQRDIPGHENDKSKGLGVTDYLDPNNKMYPKGVGLELFNAVNFCKPCKIILRGCNVGSGRAGFKLMALIHSKTGCSVEAYSTATCQDEDDGLSGRDSWFFPATPDVKYPEYLEDGAPTD